MVDDPADVADIPLHKDARAQIKARAEWFAGILASQAKLIARYNGHDVVLVKHVQEAFEVLRGPRPRPWKSEVASTLGSIVLGIGASSFITEVGRADGLRPAHTVAFVVLLLLGVATVIIAAVRKR